MEFEKEKFFEARAVEKSSLLRWRHTPLAGHATPFPLLLLLFGKDSAVQFLSIDSRLDHCNCNHGPFSAFQWIS